MRDYQFFSIRGLIAVACLGVFTIAAQADQRVLLADQDPNVQTYFILDFGLAGGTTSAAINTTHLAVPIDAGARTVRFASYFQDVESLTLPGGVETGAITVSIVPGSSTGVYDPETGKIETYGVYSITFEYDLSMFGLVSPVLLPGSSIGRIEDGPNGRTIKKSCNGRGELADPTNPGQMIEFHYVCQMNTVVQGEFTPGDVNCDGQLDAADIDPFFIALADPEAYVTAFPDCDRVVGDMNDDGLLNGADIDAFFECLAGGNCP